jgi:hypothetical protein
MENFTKASRELFSRPAEECFGSVRALSQHLTRREEEAGRRREGRVDSERGAGGHVALLGAVRRYAAGFMPPPRGHRRDRAGPDAGEKDMFLFPANPAVWEFDGPRAVLRRGYSSGRQRPATPW